MANNILNYSWITLRSYSRFRGSLRRKIDGLMQVASACDDERAALRTTLRKLPLVWLRAVGHCMKVWEPGFDYGSPRQEAQRESSFRVNREDAAQCTALVELLTTSPLPTKPRDSDIYWTPHIVEGDNLDDNTIYALFGLRFYGWTDSDGNSGQVSIPSPRLRTVYMGRCLFGHALLRQAVLLLPQLRKCSELAPSLLPPLPAEDLAVDTIVALTRRLYLFHTDARALMILQRVEVERPVMLRSYKARHQKQKRSLSPPGLQKAKSRHN